MREIKFRVWNSNKSQMIPFLNLSGENNYWNSDLLTLISGFPENFVIMQYIGLKDKNGKEIYEGDIVKFKYEDEEIEDITVIDFQNGGFVALDEENDIYCDNWDKEDHDGNQYEVIGNYYENSELI